MGPADIDPIRQGPGFHTRSEGRPFPKNTEYPYQETSTAWRAPADARTFELRDLRRYRYVAEKVRVKAEKAVTAIMHSP